MAFEKFCDTKGDESVFKLVDLNETSSYILALIECHLCEYPTAISLLQEFASKAKETSNIEQEAKSYHRLGEIYLRLGNTQKALFYSEQALKLQEKLNNLALVASSHNNLASQLLSIGNFKKAKEHSMLAVSISKGLEKIPKNMILIPDFICNLGVIQMNLCEYIESEHSLKYALELYKQENMDPINALESLAIFYKTTGKPEEALAYFNKALVQSNNKHGEYHPETLKRQNNIASYSFEVGKLKDPIKDFEKSIEIISKQYGYEHPLVVAALCNIGYSYQVMGNIIKAVEYLEAGLKLNIKLYGDDHEISISTQLTLGQSFLVESKIEKARICFETALQSCYKLELFSHPYLVICHRSLGLVFQQLNNHKFAEDHLQKSLDIGISLYGFTHPELAKTYIAFGTLKLISESLDSALEYYAKSQSILLTLNNENHLHVIALEHEIAKAQLFCNDFETAIILFRDVIDKFKINYNTNSILVASCYSSLGNALFQLAISENDDNSIKYIEAEAAFKNAISIFIKNFKDQPHGDLAITYYGLGQLFRVQNELPQACQQLTLSKNMYAALYGKNDDRYADNLQILGLIYYDLKNHKEAIKNLVESLDVYTALSIDKSTDPNIAMIFNDLRNIYESLEEFDLALHYSKQAHEIYVKILKETNPVLINSYINLGRLCFLTKSFEAALLSFRKGFNLLKILNIDDPINIELIGFIMATFSKLGETYILESIDFYQDAISIQKQSKAKNNKIYVFCLLELAERYKQFDQNSKALELFEEAFPIAKKIGGINDENTNLIYTNIENLAKTINSQNKSKFK